jgi:hypothetical protein
MRLFQTSHASRSQIRKSSAATCYPPGRCAGSRGEACRYVLRWTSGGGARIQGIGRSTRREALEAKKRNLWLYFRQSSAQISDHIFALTKQGDEMKAADYARMAEECSQQADAMPPCPERDALIEKVRQYRSYAKMDNWVASKELQPPA